MSDLNVAIEGVLFDLDGTVLDTARDLGGALNWVLEQYGVAPVPYSEYRLQASNGSIGLLKLGFQQRLDDHDIDVLRDQFLTHYATRIAQETIFFDGVLQLLSTLNEQHIPWGIVTNKPEDLTTKLLAFYPEFENCKVCIAGDTLEEKKPSPLPLNVAAQSMSVANEATLYVGDAERDLAAANSANMISVLAEYGYLSEHEIGTLKPSADLSIRHPDELLRLF